MRTPYITVKVFISSLILELIIWYDYVVILIKIKILFSYLSAARNSLLNTNYHKKEMFIELFKLTFFFFKLAKRFEEFLFKPKIFFSLITIRHTLVKPRKINI